MFCFMITRKIIFSLTCFSLFLYFARCKFFENEGNLNYLSNFASPKVKKKKCLVFMIYVVL